MKLNQLNKGFSLMETLIWVGIVGIFVGLVGVSGVTFMNKAKVKGAMQEMKVYSLSLMDFYESEGRYPSNEEGLQLLLQEQYVTPTDFKDPWNSPYIYTLHDDGLGFSILSYGADQKPGGTGLNKDLSVDSQPSSTGAGDEE